MRLFSAGMALVLLASSGLAARQGARDDELAALLQRVGESVARYFARAQSIVCLESVTLTPFGSSSASQAMSREIESELSLAWDPASDGERGQEIQMLRRVLRVNGRLPRPNDPRDCTTPEQNVTETAPLSMLLPEGRERYRFTLGGTKRLKDKEAVLLEFAEKGRPKVASSLVPGKDDCISYTVEGGSRGRLWIDANSFDVLRLEQHVGGMLDIPIPRELSRRTNMIDALTLDRADTTIDFAPVVFSDPDEVLVLPVSVIEMRETRGGGTQRLRTTTEYSDYRRFLTGSRIVR